MDKMEVMRKHNLSVGDVLDLRAMAEGTVYVEEDSGKHKQLTDNRYWSDGRESGCSVEFTTEARLKDYNRIQTLFIKLSDEEYNAILAREERS